MKPHLKVFKFALITCIIFVLSAAWGQEAKPTIESKFPGMSSGPLRKAVVTSIKGETILVADGINMTAKDISQEIAEAPQEVREQLEKYPFFILEQAVAYKLILNEAKKWASEKGLTFNSDGELVDNYLMSIGGDVSVSDEEVVKLFNDNREIFSDTTFDQVKSGLKNYLENQKKAAAIGKYVNSVSERHSIQVSILWAGQQYQKWLRNPVEKARRSRKPSMVDFGSDNCRPCEMMKPILDELQKEYQGKVNIVFVHVGKENVLGEVYGISAIPVQVFYDKTGKELFRHVGYYDKKSILQKFKELGFE
ncbi:MAG: thioredoxin family protein [Armatimonadota bacterium]|nr:thioredoxin family protein [Armatimonadota bacterium]